MPPCIFLFLGFHSGPLQNLEVWNKATMEGRHIEAKDKTGNAGNTKSYSRVRGKKRCVVERSDLEDLDDARSRQEVRPRSVVSAALRRPPSLIHSKVWKFPRIESLTGVIVDKACFLSWQQVARPALKAVVEGERSGASLIGRQFLGPQVWSEVDSLIC